MVKKILKNSEKKKSNNRSSQRSLKWINLILRGLKKTKAKLVDWNEF